MKINPSAEQLSNEALRRAIMKLRRHCDTGWACETDLVTEHKDTFEVSVEHDGCATVSISTGVFDALERLRRSITVLFNTNDAIYWLILHELHHAELGHFEMLGGAPVMHLISRGQVKTMPIDDLPKDHWPHVSLCLELQADHEAIEVMLDDFEGADQRALRRTISSIAAVMVLIENADTVNAIEYSTHPKAATRIFQLLGHVSEMWSLPAQLKAQQRGDRAVDPSDLPSDAEIAAFGKEVTLPAYWDAVALAQAAKAQSIVADLGSPEHFFADIARAKLGHWDELVTVGAKEWATLKDVNASVIRYLHVTCMRN